MVDRCRVAKKFKTDLPLVIAKHLTVYGKQLLPGDPMPANVPLAIRRKLWLANKAQYAEPSTEFKMEMVSRGNYLITGPGLIEPEAVKGKKNAEARVIELQTAAETFTTQLASDEVLIGSDKFSAIYKIGDVEIQLGDIVAAAHISSELDAKAWNELEPGDRDVYIELELTRRLDEEAAIVAKKITEGSSSEEE